MPTTNLFLKGTRPHAEGTPKAPKQLLHQHTVPPKAKSHSGSSSSGRSSIGDRLLFKTFPSEDEPSKCFSDEDKDALKAFLIGHNPQTAAVYFNLDALDIEHPGGVPAELRERLVKILTPEICLVYSARINEKILPTKFDGKCGFSALTFTGESHDIFKSASKCFNTIEPGDENDGYKAYECFNERIDAILPGHLEIFVISRMGQDFSRLSKRETSRLVIYTNMNEDFQPPEDIPCLKLSASAKTDATVLHVLDMIVKMNAKQKTEKPAEHEEAEPEETATADEPEPEAAKSKPKKQKKSGKKN